MSVTITRERGVGVITLANPPVNALNTPLRAALLAAVRELEADAGVRALVIWGGAGCFVAGADIGEMSRPPEAPFLPELTAALEGCAKPVVAALGGATLGGGCELALACDLRLASPGALIGLTETRLGLIPGAGGTQRLTRLVGEAKAIEMICAGQVLTAAEAQAIGLIDDLIATDLLAAAIARAPNTPKRRVSALTPPPSVSGPAIVAALKRARGVPAIAEAIRVIGAAHGPFAHGLALEREAFLRLRASPEAAALRHLFFAEREAAKVPGLAGIKSRAVTRAAVIGAGTMGAGIAAALLAAGLPVTLIERDEAAAQAGAARVSALLRAPGAALAATADWSGLAQADLIIEAAFEDLAVKRDIFHRLDTVAKPGAVLATNTSYLDLAAIAGATSRPADVLGLHFFAPAHIMKLLELVRLPITAPDVLATGLALAKRLGKQPVVAGNAEGFIGNRVYAAYRRHAEYLLADGALPAQVDEALESYGFAMGVFAVSDISGLDIAHALRRQRDATRDPAERYVTIPDQLVALGRLGRKTSAGWYRYTPDGQRHPDPEVADLIAKSRSGPAQGFTAQAIWRRLLAIMANEGARLLAEGIALRASDLDVAFVNGYGFPRAKGGPMWAADALGLPALLAELQAAHEPPAPLLITLANNKKRLSAWRQDGDTP
ncbi:FAD-dependent oxidoreductase [Acidocella sp.]|uniref:FAD-dependent oxidoreductase n=1 Tax=Acidocella sp. TaxID=50710 RepID=UPI002623E2EA|nr:FAD-dependent oxidoreductase [Acidocella sp.]